MISMMTGPAFAFVELIAYWHLIHSGIISVIFPLVIVTFVAGNLRMVYNDKITNGGRG